MTRPLAPVLCVFGTASDVGKSVVTAALCRVFARRGVDVCPFKAQNMSNNSAVTWDGGEIGRAQFVQAVAARAEPHVDMNPVLLKPQSDRTSQVVLLGKPVGSRSAKDYFGTESPLRSEAFAALERLRRRHELLVVEGAGSCAEVNLRAREFVNFPVAHEADAKVLLVADIDRGGVFAQVVGTLAVLSAEDRTRVGAVLINRFRGDPTLFEDGLSYLETKTRVPIVGLLPYRYDLNIEAEDGFDLQVKLDPPQEADTETKLRIAVLRLPHLSNFTDFDPFRVHPDVALHYLARPRPLDDYHLVILPGSKAVRADLSWLHERGWVPLLERRHARRMPILGVCGGYQMLGQTVCDPLGVEGETGESAGLGFLRVRTVLQREKQLCRTRARVSTWGCSVTGYEIHMGQSQSEERPFLTEVERTPEGGDKSDGAIGETGAVFGTYLHGLFDEPRALAALLSSLRPESPIAPRAGANELREHELDRLADHLTEHVDMSQLMKLCL